MWDWACTYIAQILIFVSVTQILWIWHSYLPFPIILDLTERNANHIILSYCHLPVSCRSLVDRCGSLGAVSHRFNFLILKLFFMSHDPIRCTQTASRVSILIWTILKTMNLRPVSVLFDYFYMVAPSRPFIFHPIPTGLNLLLSNTGCSFLWW